MLHGKLGALAVAVMLSSGAGAPAQETAYAAMQAVTKHRGPNALTGLTEISGIQGSPQPLVWRIVVADPAARGGQREYEVSGGNILSERTPVRPALSAAAAPIQVSTLNLDSDGAFIAANEQAKRWQIGFDSANYKLASRDAGGTPYWTVDLVAYDGAVKAFVEVSATDGAVLRASRDAPAATASDGAEPMGGVLGKTSDSLRDASQATGRTILKGAGTVQEWLTGRRTIGVEEQSPE